MIPYRRTPARKKNVRNAHGLPPKLGTPFPSAVERINKYGYDPETEMPWNDEWICPPLVEDTPSDYVWLQKPQHLAYVPNDTIVFVATNLKKTGFKWEPDYVLEPHPLSLNWKIFVKVSKDFVPARAGTRILKPNCTEYIEEKFVNGFLYFEGIRRGTKIKNHFQGKYMFSNLPPLLFQ